LSERLSTETLAPLNIVDIVRIFSTIQRQPVFQNKTDAVIVGWMAVGMIIGSLLVVCLSQVTG